ncbi:ankyrin repeat domain-containing protein 29 isoform X7 [Macaca fascicularis]|uniref:ankyrin repeat domain-containing protein 29 isoform X7 n=1 Tax=Macaca fascicularis TaxID=9541 RepID=UPI0032B06991
MGSVRARERSAPPRRPSGRALCAAAAAGPGGGSARRRRPPLCGTPSAAGVTGRGGPGVPGPKRAGSGWGGRGHVQDVLQEGNSTCQRCILGSQERKPGAAEAAVEQRPGGRGLQRQRTMHGTTLLMVAAYAGHIDCVRELVLQGADINLQRESGTTALFFAAQQGHNDVVRFLFGFGASTEFRTKDGGTALLAASQYGHMQVVETLLKHGANIHDQLYDGATALFLAAQGGYLDVIRLLLASGAKVNQPRQDGTTALLKAANKGYNDVIEELLKFSPTLGILKANELPAELTKNERILRLLRSKESPRKS